MKILVTLIIIIACSCSRRQDKAFARPTEIPSYAFLITSPEGSYWYHIVDVHPHKNNATIAIYDDILGTLVISKRFMLICQVVDNPNLIENLKKQINHFDGEKIYLKRFDGKDSCWLQ